MSVPHSISYNRPYSPSLTAALPDPTIMQPSTARTPTPPQPAGQARRPAPLRIPPTQFEPIPFRGRPCPPGTDISRPVPVRSRATSFCTTGVCPGCSGSVPGTCRTARSTSWSLGEMRSPLPHRVVSFGSAVTPQSGGSTDGEDTPRSWDWPEDEDGQRHANVGSFGSRGERRRAVRVRPGSGSRSDSSSSEADWTGSAKVERVEWSRSSRYRAASTARSQSALVEPGCCTPRADGPRPWDMTEGQGKNFASFGFKKTIDRGVSFGDTLSSKHLLKNGVKGVGARGEDVQRGGKKVVKFLKKLSGAGLRKSSRGGGGNSGKAKANC